MWGHLDRLLHRVSHGTRKVARLKSLHNLTKFHRKRQPHDIWLAYECLTALHLSLRMKPDLGTTDIRDQFRRSLTKQDIFRIIDLCQPLSALLEEIDGARGEANTQSSSDILWKAWYVMKALGHRYSFHHLTPSFC